MKKLNPSITTTSDNSFNLFFKNYPRPMWVYDLKSLSFLDVNDAAVKMYGYSREKFLTMTLKDICPKSQVVKLIKNVSSKSLALQPSGVWKHKLKSGKEIEVEIISHTIKYQNKNAVLVLVKDISKEIKLLHQLVEATAKLKVTLYSIGDALISVDLKSRIVMMNKTAERLTGWKESEAKSKKISTVFKIINEQSRKKVESPVNRVIREGIVVGLANHTLLIKKDGTEIPIADSGAPVKDENGNIIGVVLVFRDQTNERRLLKSITKLNRIHSILSDTNQSIVRIKEQNQLFKEICKIAIRDGGFLLAWIGMLDNDSSKVKVIDSFGKAQGYLKKIKIDLEDRIKSKGPTGRVFKTGKHVVCNNILKDLKMLPWHKDAIKYGFNSSAAFPIKIYGKVVGAFNLYSKDKDFFTSEETKLFDELTADLSFALEYSKEEEKKKHTETALKKSEELFRNLVENINDVFYVVDQRSTIIYASPRLFETVGFSEEEIIGKSYIRLIAPEDRRRVVNYYKNQVLNGAIDIRATFRAITKGGERKWAEQITRLVRDKNNTVIEYRNVVRDISERVAAEEHIRFQSHLINSVGQAVIASDLNGKIIFWNKAAERIYGWKGYEVIGKDIVEITPAKQAKQQDQEIMDKLRSGETWRSEFTVQRKDGVEFPADVSLSHIYDPSGKLFGMVSVSNNITDRKQAETVLKISKAKIEESEKKFNAITNQATEGIALADLNGKYIFVNPALCKMTGYSEQELLRLTVFDLTASDQPPVYFNSNKDKQGIPLEIKLKRKDGSEFYTEIIGRNITIDNQKFVLGTVRDITERRNSELALRESETKYRRLYENLRDAFVQTDMDGHIIEYNIEYLRMLGYEPKEINELTYEDITPVKWHQFENEIVSKQVLVKGYSDVYEKEYIKKDGTIFPVELRTVLITDSENQPEGMWAIIRDISDRKRNETALKESEHFLKQVQNIAKIGSYVLDIESGIWQSSELLDNIFGISKSYPHTIEGWINLIHPAHKNEMINHFQNEVLMSHKIFDKEYRIVRSIDSTERWVHGLGELVYDNLSKPVKMFGTIQDITNRKNADEALRQSEQHLRLIIESLPVAIYESPDDPNIDATWVSGNIESITGYSSSEYLADANFWHKRLHPDDLASAKEKYDLARNKGYFEMEYRWLCKDGRYKWFFDKSILVDKTGRDEFVGVIVDLSERKKTEEALLNAETRYRKFFEEDLSGDFISTVEGKIITCNLAFARIFGYDSVEEIMNANTGSFYESNSARQNFLNLIREKKSITLYEEDLITRNGSHVTVLENAAGEFDENNELVGVQGYLFDITKRKKMEEAVKKQLKLAIAANKISETIITQTDQFDILTRTAEIIGETLSADRSLIYKVDLEKYEAAGLCEWLNPDQPGITSTKNTYPLSLFIGGANFMLTQKKMLTSHFDDINPNFQEDGSGQILHDQMSIKSLLWYPFGFHEDGYYLLVINQVHSIRKWDDEEIVFLDTISKQISIAFKKIELTEELKQSRAQLKTLSNRLEKSREEERTRISREIHDILGQNLTAVKIDLVNLFKNLPDKSINDQKVEPLIKLVENSIDTVRKISSDLRPGILDHLGLIDSLDWQLSEFKNRTKLKTTYFVKDQLINLSKDKTIALFRVFQELLTNIVRHSLADEVKVKVFVEKENIILAVEDNGKGIDESSIKNPNSIGLLGMRERLAAVGGTLQITGMAGLGTTAICKVPIKED